MYTSLSLSIYIYIYICIHVYVYIYIYIEREIYICIHIYIYIYIYTCRPGDGLFAQPPGKEGLNRMIMTTSPSPPTKSFPTKSP